jgi:hypothetical protein
MKCQECELLLAGREVDASVEEHLRVCAECRAFQQELGANTLALSSFRDDELPGVKMPERQPAVPWMSAAAAAALLVLIAHQVSQWRTIVETQPRPRVATETLTVRAEAPAVPASKLPVRRKPASAVRSSPVEQPLLVKMLTPDPDVVVYWLVD